MKLENELYDILKKAALVWLPFVATLYYALASIWGWPDTAEVIGSITVVDTALGGLLSASSRNYKPATNGRILVDTSNPEKDVHTIEIKDSPAPGKPYVLEVVPLAPDPSKA